MEDYTTYMTKYVLIEGAYEETMRYFNGSKTIRQISPYEFIISVREYNQILSEHKADSQPKD
jgi:hypothetical protein